MISYLVKNQRGFSLFSVIITVIIIGVALPALFTLNGLVTRYHAKNEILAQASNLANSKMEEIYAFKKENANWSDSIEGFDGSETLADGFARVSDVTYISNWGPSGIEAYQAVVTITHTEIPGGYSLTLMLAK